MNNAQAAQAARQIHFHPLDPNELAREYPEVHNGLTRIVAKQLRRVNAKSIGHTRNYMYGCTYP